MNRLATITAAALALPAALSATPAPRDLGMGLTYYRIHSIPADQPVPPLGRPGACILDLRYARSDEAGAATLKQWIGFNASSRAPIFVIENGQTDPALLAALSGGRPAGVLVLSPASSRLPADVQVRVSPQEDRRAYEALEKGADIRALITDYPGKPRIDEAYLEKEHIADTDAPDSPEGKPPAPPLIDLLLQRAYQMDRGLVALKRIRQ
ncbi:MAG TPA: hypothetical protein VGG34_13095 [Opitutaceae bacterium]